MVLFVMEIWERSCGEGAQETPWKPDKSSVAVLQRSWPEELSVFSL